MTKTVFVVGAGASKEFGLPTGAELRDQISNCLAMAGGMSLRFEDDLIHEVILRLETDSQTALQYVRAADAIRENMVDAPSIDNFVHTHSHNAELVFLAKIVISASILRAEKKSTLFSEFEGPSTAKDFERCKDTWLSKLFAALVEGRNFSEFILALNDIIFISFNYDRCIQQFLYFRAKLYFRLSGEQSVEVMNSIHVIYPYGTVGVLNFSDENSLKFGSVRYQGVLDAAKHGIKTFTEGAVSEVGSAVQVAIDEADNLFFLGFAFHPLNMKLLLGVKSANKGLFGTYMGLSPPEFSEARRKLVETFGHGGSFDPNTCSQLMTTFSFLFRQS